MAKSKLVTLIKIVRCKEHAKSFLDGNIRCNTVRYYREHYDEHEGAFFVRPDSINIRIGDQTKTVPNEDLAGSVIFHPNEIAALNIFCMFCWKAPQVDDEQVVIDVESQLGSIRNCKDEFGSFAVVIHNTTEFLERFDRAVYQRKIYGARHSVEYIDPTNYQSSIMRPYLIPLVKDRKFSHQNEYRFVLNSEQTTPDIYNLFIGSIRDIAHCMRTEDIYDSVEIVDKSKRP